MDMARRTLLGIGAGGLVFLTAPSVWAATSGPRYLGVRRLGDGRSAPFRFAACVADANGRILRQVDLPARGHGFAVRPDGKTAVALARRPGTFAAAFAIDGDGPARVFHAPAGRHFQGHAVFEPTGRHLFATENDFDNARGCIGVYDAADGFKRVAELPSHGVGCHELVLMPDGQTAAVANGGILTHPDSGRAKLNLGTMRPNLAYVDLRSGNLQDTIGYPDHRRHKLSIRHLAAFDDGRVVFACQDQGPTFDGLPLVGLHRPGSGRIADLQAPEATTLGLNGYCGSVAVDRGGVLAAVSAPRGNRVLFWNTQTGDLSGSLAIADGCGLAPGPAKGSFVLTSGMGAFLIGGPTLPTPAAPADGAPWDNHLLAVPDRHA
ncbi:MAG: Tat pathway signal protein [Rhodospirillaceae bacterium]|nr:Tat pathway signal protein [Magnetovibrio sp.]MAY65627.1 Tat pathway signal protein [Rhodospirillaceae bacterium]